MTVSLATLLLSSTKTAIYEYALGVATALGLDVSSWQAGDPTRTQFYALAEMLEARDVLADGYVASGFLDYATGTWLEVHAEQQFGVVVPPATSATCTVTLTNTSGFVYTIAAGDLTFSNSTTGKTYHSTTGGTLSASSTLDVTVVADEAGSDSSAGATEIDTLITPLGTVTCSNALAATGVDKQSEDTTRAQCRARRGRATPNGPRDAYTDVALDPTLTLTSAITDARAYGDSTNGAVTVYLRGPSGAVAEADRALVETAILANATPLCITPTVLSVANLSVAVTYSLKLYARANVTAAEAATAIETALIALFARQPIGGDIVSPATTGYLYQSLIAATIAAVYQGDAFDVIVTAPAGNTALTNAQVAALGTVTPTVTIVANPT
jgi:hypothetical protein